MAPARRASCLSTACAIASFILRVATTSASLRELEGDRRHPPHGQGGEGRPVGLAERVVHGHARARREGVHVAAVDARGLVVLDDPPELVDPGARRLGGRLHRARELVALALLVLVVPHGLSPPSLRGPAPSPRSTRRSGGRPHPTPARQATPRRAPACACGTGPRRGSSRPCGRRASHSRRSRAPRTGSSPAARRASAPRTASPR